MRSQPMWEREWEVTALTIPEFPWGTDSWVSYPEKQGEISYPLIGSQRDREPHLLSLTCLEQSFHHTRLGRSPKEGVRVQVQQNIIIPLEFQWILNTYFYIFCIRLRRYPDTWNGWVWWWLLCLHQLHQLCWSHCGAGHRAPHVSFWIVFLPPSLLPGSWCLRIRRWANGICSGCYHPGFRVLFKLGNPSTLFVHSTGSWIFKSL